MKSPPRPAPTTGTTLPVAVYRNLHRGCWSVKDKSTRRVTAHLHSLLLSSPEGCSFRVSEAGRQRVLRTGQKNVHASVHGHLAPLPQPESTRPLRNPVRVRYNPRILPLFHSPEGKAVIWAQRVEFRADGTVWAEGPVYAPSPNPRAD